jgi:hypothetical protein
VRADDRDDLGREPLEHVHLLLISLPLPITSSTRPRESWSIVA